jgi:hypothetical protein
MGRKIFRTVNRLKLLRFLAQFLPSTQLCNWIVAKGSLQQCGATARSRGDACVLTSSCGITRQDLLIVFGCVILAMRKSALTMHSKPGETALHGLKPASDGSWMVDKAVRRRDLVTSRYRLSAV